MVLLALLFLLLDVGGREASEVFGAVSVLLGIFLVVEGALVMPRAARLRRLRDGRNAR